MTHTLIHTLIYTLYEVLRHPRFMTHSLIHTLYEAVFRIQGNAPEQPERHVPEHLTP